MPALSKTCLAIIVLGVALRLAAMCLFPTNLSRDLDAYLGIAQNVSAGRGYCSPNSETPTAFRPPLYPLLLAVTAPANPLGRCVLHLALAGMMTWCQWHAARNFGLSTSGAVVATVLPALDPLLIWYSTFPMTETLCAAITSLMLWQISRVDRCRPAQSVALGISFGLCVLARPTYWIWGGLMILSELRNLRSHRTLKSPNQPTWQHALLTTLALAITVAPWGIRNWLVLGHPILMTTHGGYTLSLANNASFYEHEVQQPWGTIWTGEPFEAWSRAQQAGILAAGLTDEITIDRWQGEQARHFISTHPWEFLGALRHRVAMFWNIVPGGDVADRFPRPLLLAMGTGYLTWWLLAITGLTRVFRGRHSTWISVALLIIAFTMMHSVYWSNIRLRAPIIPAVALFAGASLGISPQRRKCSTPPNTAEEAPAGRDPNPLV